MAECHPVGFQWVMRGQGARREGHPHRPAVHPHQRDRRPARAAARRHRHRVPRRADQPRAEQRPGLPRVRASPTRTRRRSCARTSRTPRTSTACSPASTPRSGSTTRRAGSTRARPVPASRAAPTTSPAARRAEQRAAPSGRPRTSRTPTRRRRAGSGRPPLARPAKRDETLQHPRCVFQMLKRHYARYTPEMVADVCGIEPEVFLKVAEAVTDNSDRERTTAWVYSVGWTHHTVGVQYIRTASILQALLGNMGRPGGGILALRGHASIQGSTDIPTLFNLLPGYIPMPHAAPAHDAGRVLRRRRGHGSGSGATCARTRSACSRPGGATRRRPENDFCFDYLPRLDRRPRLLPHDQRHDRGQGARLLPGRGEPGGRARQRRGCSGSGWPTWSGWSSATCR